MILTCPACDTKYVVKDGAIPSGGRQVRCASCKHSWHQGSEEALAGDDVMASDEGSPPPPRLDEAFGGPPTPDPDMGEEAVGDEPGQARAEQMVSDYPEPDVESHEEPQLAGAEDGRGPAGPEMAFAAPEAPGDAAARAPADEWQGAEEDFAIGPFDEEEPTRRGALKAVLAVLLLLAMAAAAFWLLAPPSLKAKVGLASAGGTPLKVMLTTSDRQKLSSGNDLLAISGRVINPTDQEQSIPPIRASLRVKATRQLVYQWTIAPPARSLPPGGSASFNSAEVGIPESGDELSLSLGNARS